MRLLVFLGVLVAGSFATAPDYQCWNFGQTNDIRHIYLTGVNKLREAIPKGEAPNKGGSKCPKGKNIYKLNWDCILESYAQETVDKCEEKPTLDSKLSSELSIVWNKTTLTTCNPTPLLKEQAKHWWSEVETVGLSTDAAFAKGLENFAVLANGLATRIGCAQKNCNGDLHMACLVYGKAPTSGQAIYELGEGCADNKECTTYKESKCLKAKKLCEAGYPGEEAVVPPTAGPEAPPTTSASTEAAGPGPQPEQPSSTQKPTTSKHCSNQTEMNTDPAREIFVNLHNSYRATVAKGGLQMTNGKKSRACPRMKQLLISSYSCALEAEAYATAKQCLTTDPDVENENWFIATAANKKEAATKAMEAWYNEITTSYMVQATGSQNLLLPSLKIRHFARIVWDLNTQVGCAVHKCGNKFHAVCRYGKGVGVYGSPIYFMGPRACNQCLDKCVDGALCPP